MEHTPRHLIASTSASATQPDSASAATPSYEPPSVTCLGTVEELTTGASGSFSDVTAFQDAGTSGGI